MEHAQELAYARWAAPSRDEMAIPFERLAGDVPLGRLNASFKQDNPQPKDFCGRISDHFFADVGKQNKLLGEAPRLSSDWLKKGPRGSS